MQALRVNSNAIGEPKTLISERRYNKIGFPLVRKTSPECIGFLSVSHCRWVVLSKARKAILIDRQYSLGRWSLPQKESLRGNYEKMEYSKDEKYSSHLRTDDKYSKNIQLRKEARKIKELCCRNCLGPEAHLPAGRFGPKLLMIQDECFPTLRKAEVSDKKVQENCASVSFKPSSARVPELGAFTMEKIDRFFFLLVLSALLISAINNLIHGFSDVPRPPGRGF